MNEFTQTDFSGEEVLVEDAIKVLVDYIVRSFDDEPALFSEVLNVFREFLHNQQNEFFERQHMQLCEEEWQGRRLLAVECVDKVIEGYLKERELPGFICKFIDSIWRELLINTHHLEGEDSQAWRICLQFTEDLFWSIEPKVSDTEKNYLVNMIPHLILILKDNLSDAEWDELEVDAQLDGLVECHVAASRGGVAATTESAEEALWDDQVALDVDDPLGGPDITEEASSDYYEERVLAMQLGDWVEFSDNGEELIKARLVWRGADGGQLIFANWRNEVVRRCDSAELVAKLRCWDAAIMRKVPVMARALSSVMGVLADGGRPKA